MVIENIFLNSFRLRGSDYRKLQQLMQLYWKRLKPRGITKTNLIVHKALQNWKKKFFLIINKRRNPGNVTPLLAYLLNFH